MSLGVGFMSTQITPVMSQLMSTSLMSTYHSSRMFVIGNQNRKLRCMHLLCRKYVGTDPANLLWHEARYYWTNRLRVILKDFLIVFFWRKIEQRLAKKIFLKYWPRNVFWPTLGTSWVCIHGILNVDTSKWSKEHQVAVVHDAECS